MKKLEIDNGSLARKWNQDTSWSNMTEAEFDKLAEGQKIPEAEKKSAYQKALDFAKKNGTTIADALSKLYANKTAQTQATGCSKPLLPESFLNRGKWSDYKKCVEEKKNGGWTPTAPNTTPPASKPFFQTTAGYVTIGVLALGGLTVTLLLVKKAMAKK